MTRNMNNSEMCLTDRTLKQIAIFAENLKDNIFKYTAVEINYSSYGIYFVTYVNGQETLNPIDSLYIPVFEELAKAANVPIQSTDTRHMGDIAVL